MASEDARAPMRASFPSSTPMPRIIEYPNVQQQMADQGLVCLYPNSGAFGYAKDIATHAVGWIGGEDSTIRPAARALAVVVPTPIEPTLADLATTAWRTMFPGPVWIMPKAHWAYELDFGSAAWMPGLLGQIGLDADSLSPRHDGTAVEFSLDEPAGFAMLVEGLLTYLLGSDFQMCFPGHDVVCTIHHHKQLWWTSRNEGPIRQLRASAAG